MWRLRRAVGELLASCWPARSQVGLIGTGCQDGPNTLARASVLQIIVRVSPARQGQSCGSVELLFELLLCCFGAQQNSCAAGKQQPDSSSSPTVQAARQKRRQEQCGASERARGQELACQCLGQQIARRQTPSSPGRRPNGEGRRKLPCGRGGVERAREARRVALEGPP